MFGGIKVTGPIKTLADFFEQLAKDGSGNTIRVTIVEAGQKREVSLRISMRLPNLTAKSLRN